SCTPPGSPPANAPRSWQIGAAGATHSCQDPYRGVDLGKSLLSGQHRSAKIGTVFWWWWPCRRASRMRCMPYGEWNTGRDLPDGLRRVLLRQSGVIGKVQALRYFSAGLIRQLVESGRWGRPYRSVLVAHNGPLTREQQLWAAALSVGAGRPALLGGRTALE